MLKLRQATLHRSTFGQGTCWFLMGMLGIVGQLSTEASAQLWNPLSILQKEDAPEYRPVIPASAQTPVTPYSNAPQFPLPNIPTKELPSISMPSMPSTAPGGWIDRWNQGAKNSADKLKSALTLPQIRMPSMTGGQFRPPEIQNENPFLAPLTNKLPFGTSKPTARSKQAATKKKSIWPSFRFGKPKPEPKKIVTLQDWMGQPRPE